MCKNERIYLLRILILLTAFSFLSCENKIKQKEQQPSFSLPIIINATNPFVTLLDTCPKPTLIVMPEKGQNRYTIETNEGRQTIEVTGPHIYPHTNGEAGGYTFMPNFNTEQGLALSSVACGYKDKNGNLWFGTYGGGVSRYNGYSFTNFTTTQGLVNNIVRSITEDPMGNLWFSTMGGGVSKYNGKYFKAYTTDQGLVNNKVLCSFADETGNIWFGTGGGISKYNTNVKSNDNKNCFTNFTTADGLGSNEVKCITNDMSNNLWFGTANGISKYNSSIQNKPKEIFTNFTISQEFQIKSIFAITSDKTGSIWFSTEKAVCKFDPAIGNWDRKKIYTTFPNAQNFRQNLVNQITEDSKKNIWFASSGVTRYDPFVKDTSNGKAFTQFSTSEGLANVTVYSITKDKPGNLWFGTGAGGLSKYSGKSVTSFTSNKGLVSNKVGSITEDKKGNLWFGTASGVSKYDGKSFTNFLIPYLLVNVKKLLEDKLGNLWFTSGSGVSKYDGKSFTHYTMANGLIDKSIISMFEDRAGNLWFGTYGAGLSKYDGNRIDAIEKGSNILVPDQNDLKKLNGKLAKSFTSFTTAQGLVNNTIKCITQDKDGNLWFGTNAGASKFDGKTFTNYTTAQGLTHNVILSITEDVKGNLWFGTGGGGLCKYKQPDGNRNVKPFTAFTTSDGLADNMVYAISEDTINNILWCGTNLGLSGLKMNSISSKESSPVFENFNISMGYPIKDVNTGALYLDKKGILWAGTGDKLVRFDYSDIHKSTELPVVLIQALKILGEPISWYNLQSDKLLNNRSEKKTDQNFDKVEYLNSEDSLTILNEEVMVFGRPLISTKREAMRNKFRDIKFDSITPFYPLPLNLELPFKHNNVSFDFLAVETGRPQLVRYQYLLEGYQDDWSSVTEKTNATFGNIYEGSYTFKLKAQSPDGVWSAPITYSFKVLPPWYRSWWMYLSYLLMILAIIRMFFRLRTATLRKEKDTLEQTVKIRTAQVVKQKELIEEKQKEIVDSINYAKRIQYTLLANDTLLQQNLKDYFVLFQPKDIVSGDFYWATKIDRTENREVERPGIINSEVSSYAVIDSADTERFYLAVCDSTGHGVPGAFMSLLNISFLNEAITEKNIYKPNEIFNHVRTRLIASVSQDGAQDGMDGILFCFEKGKITYAAANNAPVVIRNNSIINLPADKMPIGKGQIDKSFTLYTIDSEKGDVFYFYTDGYADQFGGPKGKKFKYKPLEELLISMHQKTMKEQKIQLSNILDDWMGNLEQVDDILIIGLKIS